jgi:WD40 repeat protein
METKKATYLFASSSNLIVIGQTSETPMLDTSVFSLPKCHCQQVNVLQFDGTRDLLASGGADGLLNIWSFKSQEYVVSHQFVDGISAMTWLNYTLPSHSIVIALLGSSVQQLDFLMGNVSVLLSII